MNDPLDAYRWLIAEQGRNATMALAAANLSSFGTMAQRGREFSPARMACLLELLESRRRARGKFHHADAMYFTRRGLEQATGEAVARYKASRFREAGTVADLGCGIGGDLLGLSQRLAPNQPGVIRVESTHTIGIDRDPIMCLLAQANGLAHGVRIAIRELDIAAFDPRAVDAWHLDPDRRPDGHRTTAIQRHAPSPAMVDRLLRLNCNGAIKLAPATRSLPVEWQASCEQEWIGHDRECKQLVLWFGDLARTSERWSATVVGRDGSAHSISGTPIDRLEPTLELGRFLYEPHSAILAARLSGLLLQRHGLRALDRHGGYLTGDDLVDDPLCSRFEVLEPVSLDPRRLRDVMRRHGIGRLELKKRHASIDLERLRRQLKLKGAEEATLLVWQFAGQSRAVLTRRAANVPR